MKPFEQVFGQLNALVIEPNGKATKALVLLHGVGSNEQNMLELAPALTHDRLVVSLRGPITVGPGAYAWFHVRFTHQGPVHNWSEASSSFAQLQVALSAISKNYGLALEDITVFGFSQGAIMTVGLALSSELNLESYIAASGRTLPEWEHASKEVPLSTYRTRRVFVSHGLLDSKLPIELGRNTDKVLKQAGLKVTYKEYRFEHGVSADLIADTQKWLSVP